MSELIPTVDLTAADAAAVDTALQRAGFLQVVGHDLPGGAAGAVRAAAREFFALPEEVKRRYAVDVGGRGWLPPGVEANERVEDGAAGSPPDLKESFAIGPFTPTGDAGMDAVWFPPNVWPAEVPALREAATAYCTAMERVAGDLLELCAASLGLDRGALRDLAVHPTWTFNINRYPPLTEVGAPAPGQFRIGPHTDFGTVTLLDREPGAGGLQVDVAGHGWTDAPYAPDALTVNVGDLLAHWTGHRWRAGRHRVLPPQAHAPDEDLISLVFFFELDHDAVVTPLAPPLGHENLEPVVSAPFLRERLDAISVQPPV
ncbi:isopenicillin N synthase family dioxygenase [Pseudonocardia phyllosphaerae]|uniref:isopenicillin N synthase family dioxygenase n=1 Tax=Pseudonocardia phyllosphaerae TaxID=3390502 RepID=UPI00397BF0C7